MLAVCASALIGTCGCQTTSGCTRRKARPRRTRSRPARRLPPPRRRLPYQPARSARATRRRRRVPEASARHRAAHRVINRVRRSSTSRWRAAARAAGVWAARRRPRPSRRCHPTVPSAIRGRRCSYRARWLMASCLSGCLLRRHHQLGRRPRPRRGWRIAARRARAAVRPPAPPMARGRSGRTGPRRRLRRRGRASRVTSAINAHQAALTRRRRRRLARGSRRPRRVGARRRMPSSLPRRSSPSRAAFGRGQIRCVCHRVPRWPRASKVARAPRSVTSARHRRRGRRPRARRRRRQRARHRSPRHRRRRLRAFRRLTTTALSIGRRRR